jgi:integrase
MATMRKQSGRYYARFYDRSRSPKRKSWPLRTHRQDVARRELTKLERAFEKGDFDPWKGGWQRENRTVKEAADAFLEAKKRADLRPNTIEVYYYVLEGLKQQTPPGIMVRDVSPEDVEDFVHAPKEVAGEEEPVSNATKRHRHSHLSTFFRWAMDKGWADSNPVNEVKKPRREQTKKAFLSPDDVEKVLAAVDAHRKLRDGEPGPTPNDEWLKQMVVVAVSTGLRRNELLNLQWIDIDLKARRLYVRSRGDFKAKNGNERAVPLVGDARQVLQEMYERRSPHPTDQVFLDDRNKSPKPDRVSRRFKFYVRKAKLPHREDLSFHSCRHTTASWLTMNGAPRKAISEIMGHTTTRMTERYSHLAPGVEEQAMEDTFGGA